MQDGLGDRLAERLRRLRQDRGWSLDELAGRSGLSRATLSRLENAEVSPTAEALNRLAAAHGVALSRLIASVEDGFQALVPAAAQTVWSDAVAGFERRSVSPPARELLGEVIRGRLRVGGRIAYPVSPRAGLEHHLVLLSGALAVTVEGTVHALAPGDALRYRLHGPSVFHAPGPQDADYVLVLIGGDG